MALLTQLTDLVDQIADCSPKCQKSCCVPCCDPPYVQCCMMCPPPILAPTRPEPVEPLKLPCPYCVGNKRAMSQEEAEGLRYANFYNNYNIDWRPDYNKDDCEQKKYVCSPAKARGVTVAGKNPCLSPNDIQPKKDCPRRQPGCPTGFKPCKIELESLAGPFLFNAKIHPCSPKSKRKSMAAKGKSCS